MSSGPADRYYEGQLARALSSSLNGRLKSWLAQVAVHFVKGLFTGTGMYWAFRLLGPQGRA